MRKKLKYRGSDRKSYNLPLKYFAFVQHYCVHWNAALAARESGLCSDSASNRFGPKLLLDPRIQAAVVEETRIQADRLFITKEKITDMLLDTRQRAKEEGNLTVELSSAMGLAKLHGLLIDRKEVATFDLSKMSEEQIKEFLGTHYNPKLIDAAKSALQKTIDVSPSKLLENKSD